MFVFLTVCAALAWLTLLALPWRPWRMAERFNANPRAVDTDLSDVTVLIPARNEAETLGRTLTALTPQGQGLRCIVVDDDSDDGTAAVARESGVANLSVIAARPMPAGWTGKLWALAQARAYATTPFLLLLDADIELAPGTIAGLRDKVRADDRALVSLMAALRMASCVERLLMPAFIYFFKLLYPFALSNRGSRYVAAAAGGCVLLDAAVLDRVGGFASLRGAVIDDCTLARRFRDSGARTWVGVTHDAISLRGYDRFAPIHAMVARTAYTQLGCSPWLLAGCTLGMGLLFVVPPLGLVFGAAATRIVAAIALIAMAASYLPTLFYYHRSPAWALALPAIGVLYLGMTWSSALRYWRGVRTAWRGRVYRRDDRDR